jgi:UDP-glucose 4-epimerase
MLKHHLQPTNRSTRVVVVGAAGFVGQAIVRQLQRRGVPVLALGRSELDLLAVDASSRLAALLHHEDCVVLISARAPVKDNAMLIENLRMMEAACVALTSQPVAHVIYVSSDAVYADSERPLDETSCAQPTSLHGVMHLTREVMLQNVCEAPLCILRPTLIYGADDPHNGYGPNRFRRLAQRGEEIILFGEGEEQRDHIYIDDVALLAVRCIAQRSEGTLNIATGTVTSFRDIADLIVSKAPVPVPIRNTPRSGPMPHNGYRAFDPTAVKLAFPDFLFTSLEAGLLLSQREELHDGRG